MRPDGSAEPVAGPASRLRHRATPAVRALRRALVSPRRPLLRCRLLQAQRSEEPLTLDQAVRLKRAWGMGSGAEATLLVDVAQRASRSPGPVLECGSGLTTLVASLYAVHGLWSLEQHGPYGSWVQRMVRRAGLDGAGQVLHAPLRSYGQFWWYSLPERLPAGPFTLVVCDGPPSETPGGRVGLLPVLRARLADGATILLDDWARPGEQAVLRTWPDEFGVDVEQVPGARHAVVTLPAAG